MVPRLIAAALRGLPNPASSALSLGGLPAALVPWQPCRGHRAPDVVPPLEPDESRARAKCARARGQPSTLPGLYCAIAPCLLLFFCFILGFLFIYFWFLGCAGIEFLASCRQGYLSTSEPCSQIQLQEPELDFHKQWLQLCSPVGKGSDGRHAEWKQRTQLKAPSLMIGKIGN